MQRLTEKKEHHIDHPLPKSKHDLPLFNVRIEFRTPFIFKNENARPIPQPQHTLSNVFTSIIESGVLDVHWLGGRKQRSFLKDLDQELITNNPR